MLNLAFASFALVCNYFKPKALEDCTQGEFKNLEGSRMVNKNTESGYLMQMKCWQDLKNLNNINKGFGPS